MRLEFRRVLFRSATALPAASTLPRTGSGGERGGVGVYGHRLPLAGATGGTWGERYGPRPDRGRGGVRQSDRVPCVPARTAPARGRARHRLADRDLPRRVSARPRLRVPVARAHPRARPRGLAVSPGRAGPEPRMGVARARRDAGPARGDRGRRDPDRDHAQGMDRHSGGRRMTGGPRTIIRTYFAITGLFNLAMSLIWGIDTLFKLGAGLDIQQVLLTNAAFTLGS